MSLRWMNWIPVAATGGVGVTHMDEIAAVAEAPITAALVAGTQLELATLRRAILADQATDHLPDGFPARIDDYIRSRMTTGTARDPAIDLFGEPYACEVYRGDYELWSVGPDLIDDTEDDIFVLVPIQ